MYRINKDCLLYTPYRLFKYIRKRTMRVSVEEDETICLIVDINKVVDIKSNKRCYPDLKNTLSKTITDKVKIVWYTDWI